MASVINADAQYVCASALTTCARSLQSVNWLNFAYSTTCNWQFDHPRRFVTHNGQARLEDKILTIVPPISYEQVSQLGDVSVVRYRCKGRSPVFGMSPTNPTHAFVFAGTATLPRLVADVPPIPRPSYNLPDSTGQIDTVTSSTTDHGDLTLSGLGYLIDAGEGPPDVDVSSTYRWDGRTFHLVLSQLTPAPGVVTAAATSNPLAQSGDLHICPFSGFDQTHQRCVGDYNLIDYDQYRSNDIRMSWTNDPTTGRMVKTIKILRHDAVQWVVVANRSAPFELCNYSNCDDRPGQWSLDLVRFADTAGFKATCGTYEIKAYTASGVPIGIVSPTFNGMCPSQG